MKDLRNAIKDVLCTAIENEYDGEIEYTVPVEYMRILQAEYNIHFVEPTQPQLEVIQ